MTSLIDLFSCAKSCVHELPDGELKRKSDRCISIAAHGLEDGDGEYALYWLLRSMRHSIGELHPTYLQALTCKAPLAH